MGDRRSDFRGKSWRREREERGRRQLAQRSQTSQSGDTAAGDEENVANNLSYTEPVEADCNSDTNKVQGERDECCQKINQEKCHESSSEVILTCDMAESSPVEQTEISQTQEGQQENEDVEADEKRTLEQFIMEANEKLKQKADLRSINTNAAAYRPEEHFFTKLDSSLKKNTAFIKRLRNVTDGQKQSLKKDMNSLNLTKYISEAAAAIVDAKLKMSDVNTAVQICSELHQRYTEFSAQLLEHWQKVLPLKKDEKITNPSKIRVDLRFYAELVCCGVFTLKEGLPLLGNLLTVLTANDKEEHNNLNILLSFCRHCGEDYAGLVPRKIRILADKYNMEIPKSDFLPADRQKGLRTLLKEYFKSLCRHLVKDYKGLQNMDRQNCRIFQTKGELSTERKEKIEAAQVAYQKLFSSTQQFSDIVDEDMPDLPKEEI